MEKRYGAINTLRTISCVGILMMHVRANNNYAISNFAYDTIIPSFTNFVFLFMTISAFGMCCGYLDSFLNNEISMEVFYVKRYKRILPFFAVLIMIDLIVSPSVESAYEAFADLTLLFGLLPNAGNITVIGVAWFLGVVFVFYLCFPFFCVLLQSKKRAWISFGISLIYNYVCTQYFDVGRKNVLYCACFFMAGGLIYLYRNEIARLNRYISVLITCVFIIIYYAVGGNTITCLFVSASLLINALLAQDRENKVTEFFGDISMELFLSHMFIFRIIEKLHLNTCFGNGWLQYVVSVLLTLAGATMFSRIVQKIFVMLGKQEHLHN